MAFGCCVPGCGETGNRNLHSFPKNEVQCSKWIAATMCFGLDKSTAWESYYKVCRKHFKPTDMRNWNLLKKGVVPSLMLPHIIVMEHSYCTKNSVRMAETSSSTTENNSGALENYMMEAVEDDIVQRSCVVLEKEAMELVEEVIIDDEQDCFSENYMVEAVDDVVQRGCSVLENEKMELIETFNIDDVQDCMSKNEMLQVTKESSEGNCLKDNGCVSKNVLESEVMGEVDENNSGVSFTNVQKCNAKRVNQVQGKKPKKSRKYNPAARKMRYLVARNKYLTKKLNELKFPKSNKKSKVKNNIGKVLKTLSSTLPPDQYDFIKLQLSNAGKRKQGYRFTFDEKTLSLSIYKQNPKRYTYIAKKAHLPSRQTLIKHSAAIRFMEGINPKLMNFIKAAVSEMEDLDKFCTIAWDEMSLTAHLDFDQIKDYIDGFEDLGNKRSDDFATHALVFMVRGMKSVYKQPIAYFLTENINSAELAELILLIIGAVSDTGLKVIGSVCDAVATNIAAVNKLIDPNCLRGNTTGNLLEYNINGSKIIHYFDAPHLIKSVRNNLLVKNLNHCVSFNQTKYKSAGKIVWNEKSKQHQLASWSDIEDFYAFNSNGLFSLIPKITEEHINPERRKMKVNLATQVLSGTFGRNMYNCAKRNQLSNNNCIGTAAILIFFNDVFDSVNGDGDYEQDKLTGSVKPGSIHFKFWDYAIRMLDNMTFTENLKTGKPNQSNVLKHFITTLKGMRAISERLFELGFESVSLRRGNQDGLENHFFIIRSYCGACTKPNARDFRCAYSTSILNNITTKHSINANCEADKDRPLLKNLKILFNLENKTDNVSNNASNAADRDEQILQNPQEPGKNTNNDNGGESMLNLDSSDDDSSDVEEQDFSENEALNCVSGLVSKKLLAKLKCASCSDTVKFEGKCLEHDIIRKQSATAPGMILPKVEFINLVKSIILKVKKMLPVMCAEENLMQKLLSGLKTVNNFGCELHRNEFNNQLKRITVLVSIHTFTKRINNILSGKITVASEDEIQKKALEFRKKKKHIGKYVAPASK